MVTIRPIHFDGPGEPIETMSVAELVEQLKAYPPEMPVIIYYEGCWCAPDLTIEEDDLDQKTLKLQAF